MKRPARNCHNRARFARRRDERAAVESDADVCATRSRSGSAINRGTIFRPNRAWLRMARPRRSTSMILWPGIEPKFAAELSELQKMKQLDGTVAGRRYFAAPESTPGTGATIRTNSRNRNLRSIPKRFGIFSRSRKCWMECSPFIRGIFGLKFEQIAAPYKWIDDLQLWAVSDAATRRTPGFVLPRHVSARRKSLITSPSSKLSAVNSCQMENISGRQ